MVIDRAVLIILGNISFESMYILKLSFQCTPNCKQFEYFGRKRGLYFYFLMMYCFLPFFPKLLSGTLIFDIYLGVNVA